MRAVGLANLGCRHYGWRSRWSREWRSRRLWSLCEAWRRGSQRVLLCLFFVRIEFDFLHVAFSFECLENLEFSGFGFPGHRLQDGLRGMKDCGA